MRAGCRRLGDPLRRAARHRGQPPSSARRPALTSAACSCTRQRGQLPDRLGGPARAAGSRCRTSGATTCANRPISRSAAVRKARRCRGSSPYRASSAATASATVSASPSYQPGRPACRAARTAPARSSCSGSQPGRGRAAPSRRHPDVRRLRPDASAPGSGTGETARGPRRRRCRAASGGSSPRSMRVELLPDHPQRQVVVALRGQHEPQPGDVAGGELPVAGRRSAAGRPGPRPRGTASWRS